EIVVRLGLIILDRLQPIHTMPPNKPYALRQSHPSQWFQQIKQYSFRLVRQPRIFRFFQTAKARESYSQFPYIPILHQKIANRPQPLPLSPPPDPSLGIHWFPETVEPPLLSKVQIELECPHACELLEVQKGFVTEILVPQTLHRLQEMETHGRDIDDHRHGIREHFASYVGKALADEEKGQ
ncbi:MAG: hypothetical protein Q9207_007189, partial [Kuettlingeria erythrocarpa]